MSFMKGIKKILLESQIATYYSKITIFSIYKLLSYVIDDKTYIKIQYKIKLGKKLNVDNPKTLNEKLQWLKLNYKNNLMVQCADKYAVREYVKNKGLENILIKQIGIYDNADEIDFNKLPNEFIIKLANGSGFNYICFDKSKFNSSRIKRYLKGVSHVNPYYYSREWPYLKIKNRIICEQLLKEVTGEVPSDYKIFCFHGEPKLIQVDIGRYTNHRQNFYDTNWNLLNLSQGYSNDTQYILPKSVYLNSMLDIARKLSEDFPFVRVDLYLINNKVYFGECTFFPWGGYSPYVPHEYDYRLGEMLNLDKITVEQNVM